MVTFGLQINSTPAATPTRSEFGLSDVHSKSFRPNFLTFLYLFIRRFRQQILGEDDRLYQTERFGAVSYQIPVPNGNYIVELHFAELYFDTIGSRVFGVEVQGQTVEASLDLAGSVGRGVPYIVNTTAVVPSGTINITLVPSVENPTIAAIALFQLPSDRSDFVDGDDYETIYLNVGSNSNFTDVDGNVWVSDNPDWYTGGETRYVSAGNLRGTGESPSHLLDAGRKKCFLTLIRLSFVSQTMTTCIVPSDLASFRMRSLCPMGTTR